MLKAPGATFEAKINIQFLVFFTRSIFLSVYILYDTHPHSNFVPFCTVVCRFVPFCAAFSAPVVFSFL